MMNVLNEYLSISPYNDKEAVEAFERVASSPYLSNIVTFLYSDSSEGVLESFKAKLLSLKSVRQFQLEIMADAVASIIEKTSSGLTSSGLENIGDGKTHLFLSNHRDIILDPAILQFIFATNDLPTTEIAVGDNLLSSKFVEDIMKSNRMITVKRGGSTRSAYSNSLLLSRYIRNSVSSQRASVWLAQRGGRTKDGLDKTSQGVLKMLEMSGTRDFVKDFSELSIVPVSISYQIEPCDFLKARELYVSRREKYVKSPGEDLKSIITGVKQKKGNIHIHFGASLEEEVIKKCSTFDKNERYQALVSIIDTKITSAFRLSSNNYISHDILHSSSCYEEYYSTNEREIFIGYMENGLSKIVKEEPSIDINELREIFLSIYANPIK